jgi:hypothetical protein
MTTDKNPVVFTKTSKSGTTTQNDFIFPVEDPHPHSLAAALLLRNFFRLQDVDYLEDTRSLEVWLEFREIYLKKILERDGDLVCKYCGKIHLEVGGRTPEDLKRNNKNPNLATIDHIQALANGGERFNEKNLAVACKKCNKDKGTKSVEDFNPKK